MSTEPAVATHGPGARRMAAAVCAELRLEPAAKALLTPQLTPRGYVETLLQARLHVAAIEVVAQALPVQLGLWWAMLCAEHAATDAALPHEQMQLFRLALRWITDQTEPARAAAERAGRDAGATTIGGLLALAAGLHGRPEGPGLVANAVKRATTLAPPGAIAEAQRAYAVLGMHVVLPNAALGAPTAQRAPSRLRCV